MNKGIIKINIIIPTLRTLRSVQERGLLIPKLIAPAFFDFIKLLIPSSLRTLRSMQGRGTSILWFKAPAFSFRHWKQLYFNSNKNWNALTSKYKRKGVKS